jgi:Bacteriophage tail sheath protein
MTPISLPGLTVEVVPPPAEPDPLRTDVAGFIGRARRGPLSDSGAVAVRLAGQNDWLRYFGGLDNGASTPYAVRGYFENGGEIAWVIRVSGPATAASALWQPGRDRVPLADYQVEAASPGTWANGTHVQIGYLASGPMDGPAVTIRVEAPNEPVETFTGLAPQALPGALASSQLIRMREQTGGAIPDPPFRRWASWQLTLTGGTEDSGAPPTVNAYLQALQALADQPEVALVALPDLYADLADGDDRAEVLSALLTSCAGQLDRLAVLDLPADLTLPEAVNTLREAVRAAGPGGGKSAAAYHPPLRVRDPLGGSAAPLRPVPASGHVAGAISRLDRERGPYYTPANTILEDAVDLDQQLSEDDQIRVFHASVNLVRCSPGQGLQLWGGRTLDSGSGRFVAHRRLLHLLVRAIRRVAAPLVFEVNGPELRLTLVRAITAVLLQSYQAGALQGDRPDQAFRVQCDDKNNPPGQDPGQLICEIDVAPAVPMEFIRLRLVIGQEARLEVVEA